MASNLSFSPSNSTQQPTEQPLSQSPTSQHQPPSTAASAAEQFFSVAPVVIPFVILLAIMSFIIKKLWSQPAAIATRPRPAPAPAAPSPPPPYGVWVEEEEVDMGVNTGRRTDIALRTFRVGNADLPDYVYAAAARVGVVVEGEEVTG